MQKPRPCYEPTPCDLANTGRSFSKPEGTGAIGVAIIGEGLGEEEAIDGQPFRPYASAGSTLQTAIRHAREELQRPVINRESFLLWNLVACNPPYNRLAGAKYEESAIKHCSVYFNYVMEGFKARNPDRRVLLACGNLPLKYLTGATGNAGERQSVSDLRGYVFQSAYGWVVPTFHPSYIRRGNMKLLPCLVQDIKRAIQVAEGSYDIFPGSNGWTEPRYQVSPSLDDCYAYANRVRDNPRLPLACDIETPKSRFFDEDAYTEAETEAQIGTEIELVQFSLGKGEGIAIRPTAETLPAIKAIFESENTKLGHNWWLFDAPRVRAAGWKVNGKVHDTMWMFRKYRPELPSGLQAVANWSGFPFPWKHLFEQVIEWYGCADVDSPHWITEWLIPQMQATGTWKHYFEHVFNYRVKVLRPAEVLGIPVDEEKRVALKGELTERREGEDKRLQELIPVDVRQAKPRRKVKYLDEKGEENYVISFGYKKPPKALKELDKEYNLTPELYRTGFAAYAYEKLGLVKRETEDVDYGTIQVELKGGKVRDKPIKPTKDNPLISGRVYREKRWVKVEPFKGSPKQLKEYIRWKRRELSTTIEYEIPVGIEGGG